METASVPEQCRLEIPELLALTEATDLLIGAAAWLEASGQKPVAAGLRRWVTNKGQPAIAKATEQRAQAHK